ncbi:hypothetical protein CYLTODRAFT_444458 [Cylindrobasidium torrendii FP15055 ss-10]|uniref:Uncharacterized protein n=1 Tax=Cylindrobasidium torrendii FP15055 ss-10 TaxID=1314674 RepID=A0A0D7B8H3_9AGAR|nr:hypothetical protein CYLTODRAFT_444458 [Cylindrobasidium torrendii FP15055 ss-10]
MHDLSFEIHDIRKATIGDTAPLLEDDGSQEDLFDRLLSFLHANTHNNSLVTPSFIFSLCKSIGSASFAPFVLAALRDWRLLPATERYSEENLAHLAYELSKAGTQSSAWAKHDDVKRIKWISRDYWSEMRAAEGNAIAASAMNVPPRPPSSTSSITCSQHRRTASEFRRGCVACRKPRLPPLPSKIRTPSTPMAPSIPQPVTPAGNPRRILQKQKIAGASQATTKENTVRVAGPQPKSDTVRPAIKRKMPTAIPRPSSALQTGKNTVRVFGKPHN